MEKKNIHRILNEIEQYFPYKRKKTTISIIDDNHVYLNVYYTLGEKLTEEGYDEKWIKQSIHHPKPGQEINCGIVLKIWNKPANQEKGDENKLILFCDNIYINPHIMPDYAIAKAFFNAQKKWLTKTDRLLGSWEIELGQKLERKATMVCLEKIKKQKENLGECLHKKDINGVQKNIKEMAATGRMLDTLLQNKKEENACRN